MDICEDERKILSMLVDRMAKGQPRQGRFNDKIEQLADQDIHMSWTSIKQALSTHMRATIMYTDSEGYRTHIRQTGQPENEAKKLFSALKVKVAKNQILSSVKV